MMYAKIRTMQIPVSRTRQLKDIFGIVSFVVAVVIGAWLINMFIFRSFNVDGPSMEDTLHTGDRLIVNRLPVTWAHIRGNSFVPERGQVVVFRNPTFADGMRDEYIVKRVIAFPKERVVVKDGRMFVYNNERPNGFNVDLEHPGARQPTDGDVDMIVPEGEVFVAGDHRQAGYSMDSRNQLGTVPYDHIVGPVAIRIFPITGIRLF